MRPRRLGVEQLESRVVLSGLGPVLGPPSFEWVSVIASLHDQAGPPQAVAQGLVNQMGGRLGHVYEHALSGFSAQLPSPAFDALSRHLHIKMLELDMLLHTTGQTVPTGVERIGTLDSSVAAIGSQQEIDVGIAIIDTGIQSDHPDLNVAGGIHYGYRSTGPPSRRGLFVDNNYNDDNGHGTHVAGIAAALDNDFGVVGVAPGAPLYAVKVLDANGQGYLSNIIKGIDWVTANSENIKVANMSLGGTGISDAYREAIQNSVAAGIVYVVSAGNDWADIHGNDKIFNTADDFIPAAYPEVATISAFADSDGLPGGSGGDTSWGQYGRDDAWWGPSNFSNSDEDNNSDFLNNNPVDSPGLGIDLVMPGVDIYSTHINNGYATYSGTSMAAPHAAGLAALYIHANGRATDAAGVYAIRQALIDQGKAWRDPDYGLADHWGPDAYEEKLGWAGSAVVELRPTVEITAPTNDVLLQDVTDVTVTATATALEDWIIAKVEFCVGDTFIGLGTLDANAWSINWDTLAVEGGQALYPDGPYTITAVATDSADKTGSHDIQVILDNVDEPPSVEINSPTGGIVSGTVEIVADATDDRGVSQVEFFILPEGDDDESKVKIGVDDDGSDGWSVAWDSTEVDDGVYTITAVAWDTGGNDTTSDPVTVTVQNVVSTATMTAELNGRAVNVNRNFWRAEATVTVVDANARGPLEGAMVWGQWNSGSTVNSTTDSNGHAVFDSGNLRKNQVSSINFTLLTVELAGYDDYLAQATITVNQNGSTSVQAAQLDGSPVPWQAALADDSPGGNSLALPDASASPAGATAPAATAAADDDAYRVAGSTAPAVADRSPTLARPDADSTADDLPITDPDAWSVYAADVDQLLAVGW